MTNRKPAHRRGKVQLINAVDLYRKMRKSLGNKRHELADEHIDEVCRIYGEFQEGERSKIFDNEDFGFHKITVDRPLRLNFQASPERIERLKTERAFENLAKSRKKGAKAAKEIEEGRKLQEEILDALGTMDPSRLYRSRPEFEKALKAALKAAGLKPPANVVKAIFSALSERDEEAEICVDNKGNPEPDPDLRDTENVPLKEDIYAYVEREVKPHVPDAWIDESRTKVGYEIPFTRHFYKYEPLRPLEEIEADIRALETEIQGMLGEVLR